MQTQNIGVVQLLQERQDRLAEVRFANAVSISAEVNAIYSEVQILNKCPTAFQYHIIEKYKSKRSGYISAELSMEMNSIFVISCRGIY